MKTVIILKGGGVALNPIVIVYKKVTKKGILINAKRQ